jgi:hypothetical protein
VGYVCGHCSLPKIYPCPMTLANPRFPLCAFIAENPTRAETYCEPCRRVAFTHDVLLREKIHIQYHIDRKCPCGYDFTEEERQQTKARLLAEKGSGKGFGQVKGSVSGTRQETHQPRKLDQETYPRLGEKQKSGQQQEVPRYMPHEYQYLNAPYGQHPMLPILTHQPFHPYYPQHAFIGMGVPPTNYYRGKHNAVPLFNGTNINTEPGMTSGAPFIDTQVARDAEAPDQEFAEDRHIQDLPAENQVSPVTEEAPLDTFEFISSPVVVSSGIFPPSRPHSSPRYEPAGEWDTRSV